MNSVVLSLSFLGLICSSTAVSIQKCKAEDSACLRQSAQSFVSVLAQGIPEFGIKSLDPLKIAKIDGSRGNLKLVAREVVVEGLKDCTIPEISRNAEQHTLQMDVLCTAYAWADYEIRGNILLLPIDGSGHISFQLSKILISGQGHLKDITQNGTKYWSIDDWSFKWDIKDKAKVQLLDLFAGSLELSQAIRNLVDHSSTEIVREIGSPIVEVIVSEVINAVNLLFSHIPVKDLSLD